MRAALYHRTSAADDEDPEAGLERLRAAAAERGWTVELELHDQVDLRRHAWPARRELRRALEAGRADVVAVEALHRVARTPYDLVDVVGGWLRAGIHLVATTRTLGALPLDTTHPAAALRLRDALDLLRLLRHDAASEAQRAARALDPHPAPGGRPAVLLNDYEIIPLWESALSIREIRRTLERRGAPVSHGTLQRRLQELRDQGRLDEEARAQAIEARGGLPKGGRPRKRRR